MSKQSKKKIWMTAVWTAAIAIVALAAIAGSSHVRAHRVAGTTTHTQATAPQRSRVRANLDALPLAFEANHGQTDPQVKYIARSTGYQLLLTSSKAILALPGVLDVSLGMTLGILGAANRLRTEAGRAAVFRPVLASIQGRHVRTGAGLLELGEESLLVKFEPDEALMKGVTGVS